MGCELEHAAVAAGAERGEASAKSPGQDRHRKPGVHPNFGTSNASFSAVSSNFLASSSSFFSAFCALSDGNDPETAKSLKKRKNSVFRKFCSEILQNFRKTHFFQDFPRFFSNL